MRQHMRALEVYAGTVTQYARANGLRVEFLVKAIQRDMPERWEAYVASHSDVPRRECEYCQREFVPANGKQRFCERKCASDARIDKAYFGGKRRRTVGLAEGICQLCKRHVPKGLSSHHVFGKENDPENEVLIALCSGCHQLVSHAAARRFVGDETTWESLISLVWLRKHGGELPANADTLHVTVEIEYYLDDEDG